MSTFVSSLSSLILLNSYNFITGLIFALQFFSFVGFCGYLANESCLLLNGKNMAEWIKTKLLALLITYRIVITVEDEKYEGLKQSKKVNFSVYNNLLLFSLFLDNVT